MANFKPIVISEFNGLGTRWEPEKAPPGMLTKAQNIRFRGESITIRPGLTPALRAPVRTGCPQSEPFASIKTFILDVTL